MGENQHTRIVKVASRLSTGAVALGLWTGIALPLLPSKACLLTNRTWPARGRNRGAMPAAPVAEDLEAATKTRENIFVGGCFEIQMVCQLGGGMLLSLKGPPEVVWQWHVMVSTGAMSQAIWNFVVATNLRDSPVTRDMLAIAPPINCEDARVKVDRGVHLGIDRE